MKDLSLFKAGHTSFGVFICNPRSNFHGGRLNGSYRVGDRVELNHFDRGASAVRLASTTYDSNQWISCDVLWPADQWWSLTDEQRKRIELAFYADLNMQKYL